MPALFNSPALGDRPSPAAKKYQGKPIAEAINNGFFTVDRRWTVKYWNRAAERLLGVLSADILGKNLWDEFAGLLPLDFYRAYHKAFLSEIPISFREYWGEMGAWFEVITYYADGNLSISFKKGGQPAQSTDHEERLKRLNELYRFVTEVTNDCLWEWDFQVRELFWIDGGHKRILGYPIENALIPQSFWEACLHPEDKVRVLANVHRMKLGSSATVWEDEYRFKKADGSYAHVHDRGHIIYNDEGRAIRMIGATQDITARKANELKLVAQRLASRKAVTAAVLSAQEKERADIGKELHDNLNQVLGAAKLYVEMARTNEEHRDQYLQRSSAYIVQVIEEIRKISKALATPGMLMGLFESIRILLDDMNLVHSVRFDFSVGDLDESLIEEDLQLNIFRIVQEQVNNILKHANAATAVIMLGKRADRIELRILDDGQGCVPAEAKGGVGIINIKSRVELLHGRVSVRSEPGRGYELIVTAPLKDTHPGPIYSHVGIV
ncbi:MAG: PAS domain-containing protein [Bacteroidota bacterium]|nr:PAS domain-containing protein [Bacteroidota bacterium]MDP4217147.1 PAS domain-containing protein [Bacteroidota bacterium]MDP4245449.1 PAS domain-containing protein [Bacteroidota bacterium]MDP4253766.1 PAS domain-containing protein [Bacteroidota bacterium]MDP4258316.1 PAS domain-containing protein [Bacteroidota bacterium]